MIDWRKMRARRTEAEEQNDRWRFRQTRMMRLLAPDVNSSTGIACGSMVVLQTDVELLRSERDVRIGAL
ncbi:hypothetical protein Hanom_Chr03g00267841 [Helianthus anomalus]